VGGDNLFEDSIEDFVKVAHEKGNTIGVYDV
jgi:hypothetical protein